MKEQRDGMLRLMEKLAENNVVMNWRPENMYMGNHIDVTFRKWSDKKGLPYNKSHMFSYTELRSLNFGIEDLLIDMVDLFLKEFKKEEEKYDDRIRFNKK